MPDDRTLRGTSYPRTVSGRAALIEPMPHDISCDALHVSFRADPARIAQFLPPGVEPLETGEGWAMVAEMTKVSRADPDQVWKDPFRCNYNEGVVGFYCRLGERVARYTAFVWVNRDWSLAMGSIFGWSKKLAEVERTRWQAQNPGFGPLGPGARLGARVVRQGRSVLHLSVELDEGARRIDALPGHQSSTLLYRYVASPSPEVRDTEQLYELALGNTRSSPIWAGKGSLTFHDCPDEELHLLGDVEATGGYLYERGWTTAPVAKLLRDYSAEG